MPSKLALIVVVALIAPHLSRAASALPPHYRERIELRLALTHPSFGRFICSFYEPKRVLVGPNHEPMTAVRCDWTPTAKGSRYSKLYIIRDIFLIVGDKVREVRPDEAILWVDGEPAREAEPARSGR